MQIKDKAIVLQSIKYADKKTIIKLFTQQHGVITCLARVSNSHSSKIKASALMPMNLVDIEVIIKENKDMQVLTEINCSYIYTSIHTNYNKLSVFQFINEVLNKTVKEQITQTELFDFMQQSFIDFDKTQDSIANFPHYFLLQLLNYFGIDPINNFDQRNTYFNCREGKFTTVELPSPIGLNKASSLLFSSALSTNLLSEKLSNSQRSDLLESILAYYKIHIPGFNDVKCLDVLREISLA